MVLNNRALLPTRHIQRRRFTVGRGRQYFLQGVSSITVFGRGEVGVKFIRSRFAFQGRNTYFHRGTTSRLYFLRSRTNFFFNK